MFPFKLPQLAHRKKRTNENQHQIYPTTNSDSCPSIASLKAGSVALASDQLTPGDRIHSVNGINTARMRPEEVISLLDNVDGEALIDVEYCLPTYASQSSLCVSSKITEVSVERIDGSLGITLRGGSIPEHPHLSRPLIITQVRPNGAAYRTGLIRIGDRLLSVDNFSLTNKTLLEAQDILKESSLHTVSTLTVEYDVNIMESVKYATGPLLVEIDRTGNEDLGIMLTNYDFESTVDSIYGGGGNTFIDHIIPASTADRCGALNAGDQLLAIDHISLENTGIGLKEAEILLKTATKIRILPLHAVHRISARGYHMGSFGNGSPPISGFSTLNSRRSRGGHFGKSNRHSSISKSIEESVNNNYSYANLGVCHSETLTVSLTGDRAKGYGFTVTTVEHEDPSKSCDIIINKITADGAAYRSGCLQSGDRIISLNHRSNLTLQEIDSLLEMGSEPTSKLALQIEFDVADTIVPSSGVFTVKLARRSHGLGITITASKSHPEDPFVISDIRRGSVAHRTGTLQNGDRLLAIDNKPLDQFSAEAAFEILQNSANEIVTLKVEKVDSPDTVVYTVELVRHGGRPLGITIAGSDDCMEPIILSRLTEGGLAERTGALHVGDRLIAINGEDLERKPLSEAIKLLQASNDRVQLKIARCLNEDETVSHLGRCNYSSPGLTSIDSAVHSWDSNPPETESAESNDNQIIKDFESVLSDPINYQESIKSNKHDSQVQFYSDMEDIFCPSPLPLPNFSFSSKYDHMSSSCYAASPLRAPNSSNFFGDDCNNEVYHVTLYKDSVYDDYGFSVSDGLYEKGVYINRIRKGGPADIVGLLKPFDRIVQVNDTKTIDFDCCLTVPLIASAGDRIDLVVARNPFVSHTSLQEGLNRKSFASSNNTITKTL